MLILEGNDQQRSWFNFYVTIDCEGRRVFNTGQYIADQKLLDKWHRNKGKDKKIINEKKSIVVVD